MGIQAFSPLCERRRTAVEVLVSFLHFQFTLNNDGISKKAKVVRKCCVALQEPCVALSPSDSSWDRWVSVGEGWRNLTDSPAGHKGPSVCTGLEMSILADWLCLSGDCRRECNGVCTVTKLFSLFYFRPFKTITRGEYGRNDRTHNSLCLLLPGTL